MFRVFDPVIHLLTPPFPAVRLDGPVNGRSAVCRDLAQDLRRMKEAGVQCIVW